MEYVSENTSKKKKALEDFETTKPGAYQSQHQSTIDGLMDQIINRKDFSYDFNADPLYQQYKDNYIQQGNQAMMNTMANAATLTGGFGNSYATAAGAQVNQQYLQGLNDVIPELYNAAMDKYNMDTDKMVSQYGVAVDADERAYGRYADALANWQANRDYLYGQYRDSVGQDQYQEQFDYTKQQDAQAYQQWLDQFNYQKGQDAQAYQQWLDQFNYQKDRDAVADRQWQTQWDYQIQQDALKLAAQQTTGQKAVQNASGGSPVVPIANETNVLKSAVQKAQVSNESTANYLAERVNDGSISMEQAQAIYAATQNLNTKKNTNNSRGGGMNTVSQMTR